AQGKALPDYDARVTSGSVVDTQQRSALNLQQQIGPDTLVQFDARSGGVSQIFRAGSYLTDQTGGTPSATPNTFFSQHGDVFGLSQAGMSSFTTVEEDLDAAGVTHLYLQQRLNGLRVFGRAERARRLDRTSDLSRRKLLPFKSPPDGHIDNLGRRRGVRRVEVVPARTFDESGRRTGEVTRAS